MTLWRDLLLLWGVGCTSFCTVYLACGVVSRVVI